MLLLQTGSLCTEQTLRDLTVDDWPRRYRQHGTLGLFRYRLQNKAELDGERISLMMLDGF